MQRFKHSELDSLVNRSDSSYEIHRRVKASERLTSQQGALEREAASQGASDKSEVCTGNKTSKAEQNTNISTSR
jgi:hypothetical protein